MQRIPSILAYGAVAALLLACLKLLSLTPIWFDWGRELVAAGVAIVAVIVGMRLAAGRVTPQSSKPESEPSLDREPVAAASTDLSPREHTVLRLLAQGLTNKAIARELGLTENTVKTHLANLYSKLGVQRRTEALNIARRSGLIP
jgi:DNA-binding NarL/FixJ family response regulator